MPRPKAILQSEFPYHVSARCINKEWFNLPLLDVWNIMSRQLSYVSWAYKARIHSFVLMSNHFHMLISTPDSNLDLIMGNFMKECSRYMNESTGRINQAYGARHFRGLIESDHYFLQAYKYIYRNPVEIGLSNSCESYRFSSLGFLLGQTQASFPIHYDQILFQNIETTLRWLNQKPNNKDWKKVEMAMSKSVFKFPLSRRAKSPSHLEYNLI